jgi:hypothetical protein
MLGQLPRAVQLVGGLFIVAGVAMVRLDELRTPEHAVAAPDGPRPVDALAGVEAARE